MRPPRSHTALLPGAVLLLFAGAGWAQPLPPPCTPARAGQHACMAQEDCECRYERGGTMLGQPAGWRWSCSLLTTCEAMTPAAPRPRGLPDGFSYAPGVTTPDTGESGYTAQDPQTQGRGLAKPPAPYDGDRGRTRLRPYGGLQP